MLYPTLNQPFVFFVMLFTGILCGILISLTKFINKKIKGKFFIKQIFCFLCTIISFALFLIFNLICNYGKLRLYVFIATILGIYIEQIIFEKLWTILAKKCYNLTNGKKKGREKKI